MRKTGFLSVMLILALVFSACGAKKESGVKYKLYDLNTDKTGIVTEIIELNKAGTLKTAEKLLKEMSSKASSGDRTRPMTKLTYQGVWFDADEGKLTVSFDGTYNNLDGIEETLTRSCICLTLLQIRGVSSVKIEVDHKPIKLANQTDVGAMSQNSFVLDFTGGDSVMQSASVSLYYPSQNGKGLIKETKNISYASNMSLERVVLKYLSAQPESKKADRAIPENTSLINLYVADGVCYINFGSSFTNNASDDVMRLRVYAIANSLSGIGRVKRVQISVDGKSLSLANVRDSENGLYVPDDSIVLNKDKEGEE
jgi:germination protein M